MKLVEPTIIKVAGKEYRLVDRNEIVTVKYTTADGQGVANRFDKTTEGVTYFPYLSPEKNLTPTEVADVTEALKRLIEKGVLKPLKRK